MTIISKQKTEEGKGRKGRIEESQKERNMKKIKKNTKKGRKKTNKEKNKNKRR